MLVLLAFVILFAIIGLTAVLWGHDYTVEGWAEGSYDARYNWNRYEFSVSEADTSEKISKVTETEKINPTTVTPVLAVKDFNLN